MRTLNKIVALAAALVVTTATALGALPPLANPANSFAFGYDTVYTGDSPTFAPPWAIGAFLDNDAVGAEDNQVWLALGATKLASTEFISKAFFSYAPSAGTAPSTVWAEIGSDGTVATQTINPFSANAYSAGAGFLFDHEMDYPTANVPNRFQQGDWVYYSITGPVGSKVSVFDFIASSQKQGGQLGPASVLHLQGLPNGGSAWVEPHFVPVPDQFTVPEPSTYALLAGLGLVGFAGYRRFKK